MLERLKIIFKKISSLFLAFGSGGILALIIFFYIAPPLAQMVRDSHGIVGAILVFIFAGGAIVSSIIYWIITGINMFDI